MRIQTMFMPEDACSCFMKNPDGTWTCIKETMIFGYGGIIPITPGLNFTEGVIWMGVDLAAWLNENCQKP